MQNATASGDKGGGLRSVWCEAEDGLGCEDGVLFQGRVIRECVIGIRGTLVESALLLLEGVFSVSRTS